MDGADCLRAVASSPEGARIETHDRINHRGDRRVASSPEGARIETMRSDSPPEHLRVASSPEGARIETITCTSPVVERMSRPHPRARGLKHR